MLVTKLAQVDRRAFLGTVGRTLGAAIVLKSPVQANQLRRQSGRRRNTSRTASSVIQVTPSSAHLLNGKHRAGTEFVLHAGIYDVPGINFLPQGTVNNPVVMRARGEVVFAPRSWPSVHKHSAVLNVKGHHAKIEGIRFERCGGRHINVHSNSGTASSDIVISRCHFVESYRHSVVVQGLSISFENCIWSDNCQFNQDHLRSVWPYTVGSWYYRLHKKGPLLFSQGIRFRRCQVHRNHGEGIHPSYARYVIVEDCDVRDNLYVNIYLNTARKVTVRRNRVTSSQPMLSRFDEPPRGIVGSVELYTPNPQQPNEDFAIHDNWIDGGIERGIRVGIQWMNHRERRNNSELNHYSDWQIRGNTIRNVKEHDVSIAGLPAAVRAIKKCSIDREPRDPSIAIENGSQWSFRSATSGA